MTERGALPGRLFPLIIFALSVGCGGKPPPPSTTSVAPQAWLAEEPVVRIGIAWSDSTVAIAGSGRWWVRERGSEQPIAVIDSSRDAWKIVRLPFETGVRVARPDGYLSQLHLAPLVVEPIDSGVVIASGVAYPGTIEVQARSDGTLTAVNIVRLEQYLEGVVAKELGGAGRDAVDALRAQAVAARTYSLKRMGSRADHGFDLYGSVLDQAYKGSTEAGDSLAIRAVRETKGEALIYNGLLIDAYYHSTCGGHTASVELVFDDPPAPYLVPVSDARGEGGEFWCQESRYFRWTVEYDAAELDATMARNLPELVPVPPSGVGVVRDVEAVRVTPEGRVVTVAITTTTGRYLVSENDIRVLFSSSEGNWLRSTLFLMRPARSGNRLTGLTLVGGGWGHGVGMCQVGAMARARGGRSYRDILATYYPGTSLARMY